MRFFKGLRNRSQKRGRTFVAGTPRRHADGTQMWIYRFLRNDEDVPASLIYRDVADCCLEHVAKLATIVLEFTDEFPFQSCYRCALTPQGLESLALDPSDVLAFLGFGYVPRDMWREDLHGTLRLMRSQVDGVDFQEIERLASYQSVEDTEPQTASDALSESLARSLVRTLSRSQK